MKQTYRFRGDAKNVPLALVNMNCSATTRSGSHVAALLGKSWIFLPEYLLRIHVICGNFFCPLCPSSHPTNSNHTA
jgi:hypothetical protein